MAARGPWVQVDDAVAMLVPTVGAFAPSPAGRWLAWAEGPAMAGFHVTERGSRRTVCSVAAPGVFALAWRGEDELRALCAVDGAVRATRYAVPDGGVLGVAVMPRDGLGLRAESSADGRVTLVQATRGGGARGLARAFLVGADAEDGVTLVALRDPRAGAASTVTGCSLSPDGDRVAIVRGGAPRVVFVRPGGALAGEVAGPAGEARAGPWLSSTEILLEAARAAAGADLWRVDAGGEAARLGEFPTVAGFDAASLHPERDRALLRGLHRVGGGRWRTVAVCLRLAGGGHDVVTLSGDRDPADGARDGGACWGADGALFTLTQSPAGVANLTRRDAPGGPGRRLAKFGLPGQRPHDLTLAATPARTGFVATWRAFDRGPADAVRRLALLTI